MNGYIASLLPAGNLVATYPTLTAAATASMLNAAQIIPIPSSYWYIGKLIRVTAISFLTSSAGSVNITYMLYLGGSPIWSSGVLATVAGVNTQFPVKIVVDMKVQSLGATGAYYTIGEIKAPVVIPTSSVYLLPTNWFSSSPTMNTTITNTLDFQATLSGTGPTIQMVNYNVEDLN